MAQFECEYCDRGFEQRSAYKRHLLTAHPKRAPSAADLEKMLKGIEFPQDRQSLLDAVGSFPDQDQETLDLLRSLPERQYRDAAEVAKALGEAKSHRPATPGQPSQKGGERALASASAANLARALKGITFPASKEALQSHARAHAHEDLLEALDRFPDKQYRDMAEVTQQLKHVTTQR